MDSDLSVELPRPEITNDIHQNNDIIFPNSTDLDWSQITYAINYKRLIFIDNCKTWLSFYNENGNKYTDYTPEELCNRFLQRVLPNIYEYELSEDELYLLNLLDLHPNFVRTDSGFNTLPQREKLKFPLNEAAIENFMIEHDSFDKINLAGKDVTSNQQILITGQGVKNSNHCKYSFNKENAALLSVALSTEEDLPNCELLTTEEVWKRLKAAKSRFESHGEQLENINISVDVLLKKLHALNKLKQVVMKLVGKIFRTQNEF